MSESSKKDRIQRAYETNAQRFDMTMRDLAAMTAPQVDRVEEPFPVAGLRADVDAAVDNALDGYDWEGWTEAEQGALRGDLLNALRPVMDEAASLLSELRKERDEVRAYFEELWREQWSSGYGIDGADMFDLAEKHGLLVEVPASEEVAREYDTDTMLTWKWSALLSAPETKVEP